MPQAKSRKNKPVKFTTYTDKRGVRDCLVWPDPANDSKNAADERQHIVLPKKGDVGKPTLRLYEPIDPSVAFHAKSGENDRVIDALRGWPGNKNKNEDNYSIWESEIEKEARLRSATKKKSKKSKSKVLHDPLMGELISHKFMKDAVLEREQVNREAAEAARKKAKQDYAKKFPKDIKATKASQLRSIAMAEAVYNDPKSLWQMPKFRENAEPHLDTFRHKKSLMKNNLGSNKYSKHNKGDNLDHDDLFNTCTCAEEQALGETKEPSRDISDYPEPELDFTAAADELMDTSDNM